LQYGLLLGLKLRRSENAPRCRSDQCGMMSSPHCTPAGSTNAARPRHIARDLVERLQRTQAIEEG